MRTFLADLLRQLKGIWSRLDGSQRLVVSAVMAAAVVGLLAIVWFAGRPSWQEVVVAGSPDEVRDARRILGQAGIAYQSDETGKGILVERSKVALANQLLFEGGLRSGSGSKSNDGVASMLADSDTRADILDSKARARAEDAISRLDGVLAVTVTATRPRRSAFSSQDKYNRSSATVALRLRPGVGFEQVARAAMLQAASAVGVPQENVEVVNSLTHARWRYDPDRDAGTGTAEFLAEERRMSEAKTHDAQAALDAVYPGKTIVTVNVELAREWETVTTKVLPAEPLVVSEKSTKDNTTNGTGGAGGDPSAAASGAEVQNASLHKNTTSKETRDKQYVTDIGERRTGMRASPIKRLSVAMLYDQSLDKVEGFQKEQLASVVKSIVGWDGKRDEETAFSTMGTAFPAEAPLVAAGGPGMGDLALRWAPTAAQVIGLVLVLVFLRSLFRRPGGARAAREPEVPVEIPEQDLPAEEQARRMRREIERAIAQDPAALARLLESWIAEQAT